MTTFSTIENKWQKLWEKNKVFQTKDKSNKPKFYCLEMFPYPSGYGLHMGHAFNYTIGDIQARTKRMQGYNVLYPMGYDAFGLPAENAAIKVGTHPATYTQKAIKNYIKQQKGLGLSYDWDRMVNTSLPEYYKWNQYFFIKFFENDLVYRKKAPVNWCPKCDTVLANEQVHNGYCWRHSDTLVEEKQLEQWFIRTTKYADELLKDVQHLDWPDRIKLMQTNWIGKSTGINVRWKVENQDILLDTYTTTVDTIYGVTFVVISPDHPLISELLTDENKIKVEEYIEETKLKTDVQRQEDKSGIFTGTYLIHPITNQKIQLWVADYVLMNYGTGVVMGVPAHDERDHEFATKYNLEIIQVLESNNKSFFYDRVDKYNVKGTLVNSETYTGKDILKAREEISQFLIKNKQGKKTTQYKLRDWLVSRQRYWGTPIPMVYCDTCGILPVKNSDLPIKLPKKVKFGKGNPLATNTKFIKTKCPKCKKPAKRETDTMDTFFDSSWYYLRYIDAKNKKEPFDKNKVKYWMPVDQYIGGAEHACMHLIYARFFTKALRDLKLIPSIDEPFTKLFNQGILHAEDGNKMSKSLGNIVEPETISKKYGIDTARFFLVSVVSPDKDMNWSSQGIEGSYRLLNKVYNYFKSVKIGKSSKRVESKLNKTIDEVTKLIASFDYNIALIQIRELFESFESEISKRTLEDFLKILHPFCPHITEELWTKIGNKPFITLQKWPKADLKKIDPKYDFMDKLKFQINKDIEQVIKLTNIKPKQVKLFIAEPWKYSFFKKLKSQIEKTSNFKEILPNVLDQKHNQEIVKITQSSLKDRSKLPEVVLSQEEEKKLIQDLELPYKIVIILEQQAQEPKAKQALPGKPAILLE